MPEKTTEDLLKEYLAQREEQIEEKDERILALEREVEDLEHKLDGERWGWAVHRDVKDNAPSLPIPRLEIVGQKLSDYKVVWDYHLVYMHLCDGILELPIGRTTSSGSHRDFPRLDKDGRLDLPFRDGAHIHHDAVHLGLPAYVRVGDQVQELDLSEASNYCHQVSVGEEHRSHRR
jgi:hypothetical protein